MASYTSVYYIDLYGIFFKKKMGIIVIKRFITNYILTYPDSLRPASPKKK